MENLNNLSQDTVLECKDLRISFKTLSGTVKAVRGINFSLKKGKTLAIVGESGSGKSVTSRAILGILANNKIVEGGQILYDGKDLLQLSEDQFTSIRGSKISMIFQDPLSSLNPIMRVGKQLTEPMFLKAKTTRREAKKTLNTYIKCLTNDVNELKSSLAKISKSYGKGGELRDEADNLLKQIKKLQNQLATLDENDPKYAKIQSKIAKLELSQSNLKTQEESLKQEMRDLLETSSVQKSIKDAIQERYAQYLSSLALFKEALINYKEKVFITSFDYKAKIHELEATLQDEQEKTLAKIKKLNEKIEKLSINKDENASKISELNTEKREIILTFSESKKSLRNDIKHVLDFDTKEALSELKIVEKSLNECKFPYAVEKDDVISVFITSLRRYIESYLESIKLDDEETKFLEKYDDFKNGEELEVPAKIRAKRREIIVPFYEFYDSMVTSIDNVIEYVSNLIKSEFNIQTYYETFIENFKKQAILSATKVKKSEAKERALKLLEEVGIPEPERRYNQYPFEFSGGMRQRIVIAIALSSNPEILICDEPTTALDVTIQAQILELINRMKKEHNLSIIFITHDLGVVANMADDIAVMYAGKIVEYGSVYDIFYDPRHPYTWALLGSMPDLDTKDKLEAIPGTPPNMLLPPKGDAFAARNKYAMNIDYAAQPPFFKVSETHSAATWLLHENAPDVKAPKVVIDRIYKSLKKNPENKPTYTNPKNSILEGGNK